MDSTRWNDFKFRDDDDVVATYGNSGTTWMQQIIGQLLFDGADDLTVHALSPWVDLRIVPPEVIAALETQTHRRFLKTHLPVDALVFSPKAKYIYIGRDGRDAAWSFYNHHANSAPVMFEAMNNTPGRVGPRLEPGSESDHEFFIDWFERDGFPFWPFWENVRSWWAIRDLPNLKLIHFNDMKSDLGGSIREIADFLGIAVSASAFPKIVSHCTFEWMKNHAEQAAPRGGIMWNGGATTFINKGRNGRWRNVLSADEIATYEARALSELGPECAVWLEGRSADL